MGRTIIVDDRELTDEGKQLWDLVSKLDNKSKQKPPKNNKTANSLPEIRIDAFKLELIHIRRNLKQMITNSENVIKDCDDIISAYQTEEEYLTSDAKIAKMVHENLIKRLNKILNGEEPFDKPIIVDPDPLLETTRVIDNLKRS